MYESSERVAHIEGNPTVDEVDFKSLYRKSHYEVITDDGWSLVVTRYAPTRQRFAQPLLGEPLLLVHGFSQNRHCWTSGQFVKNLLFFGADIHIVELRGHGLSSVARQRRRAERTGSPPPADLDYAWDIDSYFLHDLPATIERVKEETGRDRIFYCGHSMGGMLGYGLAGLRDDLEGLITVGAACDLGKGFFALKLLALAEPAIGATIDSVLFAANVERRTRELLGGGGGLVRRTGTLRRVAERLLPPDVPGGMLSYRFVPMDVFLRWVEGKIQPEREEWYRKVAPWLITFLTNPDRATVDDVRWLLREGGEKEPRRVIEQFARWIRNGDLACYRTGYDFRSRFDRIEIPMAIIFGDKDRLASVRSTAAVYRAAKSHYLLWRPVKGNSHVELTMGHDIRQICYDIKNLIEFARTHRSRRPSLPRLEGEPALR